MIDGLLDILLNLVLDIAFQRHLYIVVDAVLHRLLDFFLDALLYLFLDGLFQEGLVTRVAKTQHPLLDTVFHPLLEVFLSLLLKVLLDTLLDQLVHQLVGWPAEAEALGGSGKRRQQGGAQNRAAHQGTQAAGRSIEQDIFVPFQHVRCNH